MQTAPDGTSRDKKYAYSLYLDLLLLLLKLSGQNTAPAGEKPQAIDVERKLAASKLARALAQDAEIRALINRGDTHINDYDAIAQHIHDAITSSAAFADWHKRRSPDIADDAQMWCAILPTVIAKDPKVMALWRSNPDFTLAGAQLAVDMVVETLNSYRETRQALNQARNDLQKSLDKAYDLYVGLFALIIKLTDLREEQIEAAKTKHLATPEDLNPNTKFIDNALVERLRQDEDIRQYMEKQLTWQTDPVMLRKMLDEIMASEVYSGYMRNQRRSYQSDCDFWRELLKSVVFESDELAEALENESVFWNDDLPIMSTFVLKTIKQMSLEHGENPEKVSLLPPFKDEEDERFGDELFSYAVENRETYRSYIDRFINTDQWDAERIAFMDIVVMITAIAEFIHYPAIPVAVTMNEYIEIANSYSTARSGQFVNGLLFSVVSWLNEQGIINKK